MRTELKSRPREFACGVGHEIILKDFGKIFLDDDELVSFVSPPGREYDIVKKSWGYYATPSVNKRLSDMGFKTALARGQDGKIFILIVEPDSIEEFKIYCKTEKMEIERWLDESPLR